MDLQGIDSTNYIAKDADGLLSITLKNTFASLFPGLDPSNIAISVQPATRRKLQIDAATKAAAAAVILRIAINDARGVANGQGNVGNTLNSKPAQQKLAAQLVSDRMNKK